MFHYFDNPIKLFSELTKFLDTAAKTFFAYTITKNKIHEKIKFIFPICFRRLEYFRIVSQSI